MHSTTEVCKLILTNKRILLQCYLWAIIHATVCWNFSIFWFICINSMFYQQGGEKYLNTFLLIGGNCWKRFSECVMCFLYKLNFWTPCSICIKMHISYIGLYKNIEKCRCATNRNCLIRFLFRYAISKTSYFIIFKCDIFIHLSVLWMCWKAFNNQFLMHEFLISCWIQ